MDEFVTVFLKKDVNAAWFYKNKMNELFRNYEELLRRRQRGDAPDPDWREAEVDYLLHEIEMVRQMLINLGTAIPREKAQELGLDLNRA